MSRTSETSSETTWEGYSNYRDVSQRVAESVSDAVDAYSALDSRHVEGASISQEYAATARQHIFAAAIRLYTEMNELESEDPYGDILGRWEGEDDDDGFLTLLSEVRLTEENPEWLMEFVEDIRRAGWELGYLQAGRTKKKEPQDPAERDTEAMFDKL